MLIRKTQDYSIMQKDIYICRMTKQFLVYIFVALLYDRMLGGLIDFENDFDYILPDGYEKDMCILKHKTSNDVYQGRIDELVAKYDLNTILCDYIKKSAGIRYFMAMGFHDASVRNATYDGKSLKIVLDLQDRWVFPKTKNTIVTIEFANTQFISTIALERIDHKYCYVSHNEVYLLDDGNLLCWVELYKPVDECMITMYIQPTDVLIY